MNTKYKNKYNPLLNKEIDIDLIRGIRGNYKILDYLGNLRNDRLDSGDWLKHENKYRGSMDHPRFESWKLDLLNRKVFKYVIHEKLYKKLEEEINLYLTDGKKEISTEYSISLNKNIYKLKNTELNRKKFFERAFLTINEFIRNLHISNHSFVSGVCKVGFLEILCPRDSATPAEIMIDFLHYIGFLKGVASDPVFTYHKNRKDFVGRCRQFYVDKKFIDEYQKGKLIPIDIYNTNISKFITRLDQTLLNKLFFIDQLVRVVDEEVIEGCKKVYESGWSYNNSAEYYSSKIITLISNKSNILDMIGHYDTYGGRSYTPITNFKKSYRKYLKCVDWIAQFNIENTIRTLSGRTDLTRHEQWLLETANQYKDQEILCDILEIDIHSSILVNLAILLNNKKLKDYITEMTWQRRDMYIDMMIHSYGINQVRDWVQEGKYDTMREGVKRELMRTVNSRALDPKGNSTIITKFFNDIDPKIVTKLNKYKRFKTHDHRSIVPRYIQVIESHLMHDFIMPEIARFNGINDGQLVSCGRYMDSIHDCVLIPMTSSLGDKLYFNSFKDYLMSHLEKYTGIRVNFEESKSPEATVRHKGILKDFEDEDTLNSLITRSHNLKEQFCIKKMTLHDSLLLLNGKEIVADHFSFLLYKCSNIRPATQLEDTYKKHLKFLEDQKKQRDILKNLQKRADYDNDPIYRESEACDGEDGYEPYEDFGRMMWTNEKNEYRW